MAVGSCDAGTAGTTVELSLFLEVPGHGNPFCRTCYYSKSPCAQGGSMSLAIAGPMIAANDIYERDIRRQVETGHHGKVVAIDVESGNWAVGDNVIAATDHLWERCPEAYDIWSVRVGRRALHHFGGRPLGRAEGSRGCCRRRRGPAKGEAWPGQRR